MNYLIKNLKEKLEKLGLSELEAEIYLASLQLEPTSVLKLNKITGVKRSTIYVILESLKNKGLITIIQEGKKKLFKSVEPKKIDKITKKLRREVIKKEEIIDELIPELSALAKKIAQDKTVKVKLYKGQEQLWQLMEESAESQTDIYFFGSTIKLFNLIDDHLWRKTISTKRERIGRGKIYNMTDKSQHALDRVKNKTELRNFKIIKDKIDLPTFFVSWNENLAIFNLDKELSIVVIENSQVVELFKFMFKMIWDKY